MHPTRLPCLLIFLCVCSSLFAKEKPTPIHFQPDWFANGQFAGFFAARAQGIYEKEGLDVTIGEFAFGNPFLDTVASNQAQFGTAEAYILMDAIAEGKPLVALGAVLSKSPAGYIYLEKSGIHTPQDLVGKRIGIHAYSEKLLPFFLSKAGIPRKSVSEILVKHDMSKLLDGSVDLHQGYAIDEMLRLKRMASEPVNILTFEQLGLPMYAMVIYTSRTFAEKHPEQVKSFLKASQGGWHFALENPKTTAKILMDSQSNPPDSAANLTTQIQAIEAFMAEKPRPLLSMERAQWETMYATFIESGLITKPIDLDSMLHTELSLLE